MSEAGFTFDFNVPRSIIRDGEIIEGLRAFGAARGHRAFSSRAFNAWPDKPCTSETAADRFGSWRAALRRAGIEGGRPKAFTAEELVANLERVWRQIGRPPGANQLRLRGECSYGPYLRIWGSLRRACQMVAQYHAGEITREALLRGDLYRRAARKPIPPRLRWSIFERDGFACVGCGASRAEQPGLRLEVDHIVPMCQGGPDDAANLRTLCRACNRGKGGRLPRAA